MVSGTRPGSDPPPHVSPDPAMRPSGYLPMGTCKEQKWGSGAGGGAEMVA